MGGDRTLAQLSINPSTAEYRDIHQMSTPIGRQVALLRRFCKVSHHSKLIRQLISTRCKVRQLEGRKAATPIRSTTFLSPPSGRQKEAAASLCKDSSFNKRSIKIREGLVCALIDVNHPPASDGREASAIVKL